jgi:hypothetical protein
MTFSENFFVAREDGFAEGERFGRADSRQKKARKIATHAICVRMLGTDRFEDCQGALNLLISYKQYMPCFFLGRE